MKACEGRIGRVFVMRLEDGDMVPQCIERFAEEKGVSVGQAISSTYPCCAGAGGADHDWMPAAWRHHLAGRRGHPL